MSVANPISTEATYRPAPQTDAATRTLDCTGMICPLPIYKTSRELATMEAGEVLEVICTDPAALSDFRAFARRGGHDLESATESEGVQTFRLRKDSQPKA